MENDVFSLEELNSLEKRFIGLDIDVSDKNSRRIPLPRETVVKKQSFDEKDDLMIIYYF